MTIESILPQRPKYHQSQMYDRIYDIWERWAVE